MIRTYTGEIDRGEEGSGYEGYDLYQDATKCVLRVFTNLSRTLLAWRRSFSRTALVPGSSQSSSALEQQLFKDTSKLVREFITSRRGDIFRLIPLRLSNQPITFAIYVLLYVYIYTYMCVHVCMYVGMYVCMYVCIIRTYTHAFIYLVILQPKIWDGTKTCQCTRQCKHDRISASLLSSPTDRLCLNDLGNLAVNIKEKLSRHLLSA